MKKKGAWSEKEDSMLKKYLENEGGAGTHRLNWKSIPHKAGLNRCGKSCRLRWKNYLDPLIKRGNFSPQEQDLILRLQSNLGNKWAQIATQLPGRTDNDIKNLWNTKLKKKKLQQEAISQLQQLQTPIMSDNSFFSNHDYALIAEAAKNSALQQWITMKLNQEWSWLQLQLQLQSMQPLISNDAWFEGDVAGTGSDLNYNYSMLPALAVVSPTEETQLQISVNEIGNEMSCEFVDLGVEASNSDVYAATATSSFYYDHFGAT